jgi:hypothetical protein
VAVFDLNGTNTNEKVRVRLRAKVRVRVEVRIGVRVGIRVRVCVGARVRVRFLYEDYSFFIAHPISNPNPNPNPKRQTIKHMSMARNTMPASASTLIRPSATPTLSFAVSSVSWYGLGLGLGLGLTSIHININKTISNSNLIFRSFFSKLVRVRVGVRVRNTMIVTVIPASTSTLIRPSATPTLSFAAPSVSW